jgi:DNA-binding winged helix-turn-helix (wHTH) protein
MMTGVTVGADRTSEGRVRATRTVQRDAQTRERMPPPGGAADAAAWEFGPFRLLACGTLLEDGRAVPLTPKEEGVLRVLVVAEGRRVSKDAILEAVWEAEAVSDSSLARAVHTLRRRLGERACGPVLIKTSYGRGYQLAVPVRRID